MTAPAATLAVRFSADGSETVKRAIENVTRTAEKSASRVAQSVSSKYGNMALSAASSFNAITFSGKVSGEALKNVLQQTALVGATLFGAGGPLVAAVAVAGMAMSNIFFRARDDAKQAREAIEKELRILDRSRDPRSANERLTNLIAGDPTSEDTNRQRGRAALEREIAEITARISRVPVASSEDGGRYVRDANRLRELRAAVAAMTAEYDRLVPVVRAINEQEQRRLEAERAISAQVKTQTTELAGRVMKALPTGGRSASTLGDAVATGGTTAAPKVAATAIATKTTEQLLEAFRAAQSTLSLGIADSIGMGLAAGIATAVQSGNVGQALASLGSSVLAGLGSVFAQIAAKAIAQATLMAKFMAFLTANPAVALAAAVAMMALARSMGGGRGGAGFGGGGVGIGTYGGSAAAASTETVTRLVFGNNSATTAAGMTPRQALNVTLIGPDDPTAQRAITDLLRKAESRGLSTGGR